MPKRNVSRKTALTPLAPEAPLRVTPVTGPDPARGLTPLRLFLMALGLLLLGGLAGQWMGSSGEEKELKLIKLFGMRCGVPEQREMFTGPVAIRVDRPRQRLCLVDGAFNKLMVWSLQAGNYLGEFDLHGPHAPAAKVSPETADFTPVNANFDPAGNLYVSDRQHGKLLVFGPDLKLAKQWPAFLPHPVAADSQGRVVLVDPTNQSLVRYDPDGKEMERFGQGKLRDVGYLTMDEKDNLYLIDRGLESVVVFSDTGKFLRAWKVPFKPFGNPALDVLGDKVYVSEHDRSQILAFTTAGRLLWRATAPNPTVIAVDANGLIYAPNPNGVAQYQVQSGKTSAGGLGAFLKNQLSGPEAGGKVLGFLLGLGCLVLAGVKAYAAAILAILAQGLAWLRRPRPPRAVVLPKPESAERPVAPTSAGPVPQASVRVPRPAGDRGWRVWVLGAVLVLLGIWALAAHHPIWGWDAMLLGIGSWLVRILTRSDAGRTVPIISSVAGFVLVLMGLVSWFGQQAVWAGVLLLAGVAVLAVVFRQAWLERAQRQGWQWLSLGLVGGLIALFISAANLGINYGHQWDEEYHFKGLKHAVQNLTFLPQGYYYGGLYFDLGFLALAPEIVHHGRDFFRELNSKEPVRPFTEEYYPALAEMKTHLSSLIFTSEFKLRVLGWIIVLSSLAILALFLAGQVLAGSRWEGLLAAGLLALCWEFNYHARHLAMDSLLTLFSALTLYFSLRIVRASTPDERRVQANLAAVSVGLGLAAKMPSLFLFVPLLVAWMQGQPVQDWKQVVRRWLVPSLKAVLIALAVYALLTPGVLVDPVRAMVDWARGTWDYRHVPPVYPYSVQPLEHWFRVLVYFATTVSSYSILLSLGWLGLAVWGGLRLFREDRPAFWVVLSFLTAYFAALSMSGLMIARNYLILLPFFFLLAAHGFRALWDQMAPQRWWRVGLAGFLGVWLVYNTTWLLSTAASVRYIPLDEALSRLTQVLKQYPQSKVYLSPALRLELTNRNVSVQGFAPAVEGSQRVALLYREHDPLMWIANRPRFYERLITSQEVNYDYYPTWEGNNTSSRIVIMSSDHARKMGIYLK